MVVTTYEKLSNVKLLFEILTFGPPPLFNDDLNKGSVLSDNKPLLKN